MKNSLFGFIIWYYILIDFSGVQMDIQLQELIDRIKKDGVASAESQAADIVKAAGEGKFNRWRSGEEG